MYIQPDSKIYILAGCPLDPTYDHTLYWKTEQEQQNYFASIAKYKLTQQSYQRLQKGVMRVKIKAEDLYDCNYVMFQNTAFGEKWFYAFIKGVEYVNNVTSEITFMIDVMQTWHFHYTLGQCFVDREHSKYDNVGENTVPENLEQGPYVCNKLGEISPGNMLEHGMIMLSTFNQALSGFPRYVGEPMNDIYTGLFVGFYENGYYLNEKLKEIAEAEGGLLDGIVAIYMCPFDQKAVMDDFKPYTRIDKWYKSLDGYVPKNAKMFTYPYNVLHIYTSDGTADFKYEQFSTKECTFQWQEAVIPEPTIALAPTNYAGYSGFEGEVWQGDMERALVSTLYPQCSWSSDVYQKYMSENNRSLSLARATTAINGAFNTVKGIIGTAEAIRNPAVSEAQAANAALSTWQTATNAYLDVKAQLTRLDEIKSRPPEVNGNQTSGSDFSFGSKKFRYKCLTIKAEYARIIDEYFTMYGYATHRVKTPNRTGRPHWNYVKTSGCVLEGSVPADDVAKICAIYNNGITFWHNPEEIGDYSLDNRPGVG